MELAFIDLPNEVLMLILTYICLAERMQNVSLVCTRLNSICTVLLSKATIVIRSRRAYHKNMAIFCGLNIPLQISNHPDTFCFYFDQLSDLNRFRHLNPMITRLVVNVRNDLGGVLRHLFGIIEPNQLKSIKLIGSTITGDIWQLLARHQSALIDLSLGTDIVDMTNSEAVMQRLVTFGYANFGQENHDVFAILERLSDTVCNSIGIHFEGLNATLLNCTSATARAIRGHIERLRAERPALWTRINRITELDLFINKVNHPLVNFLNVDSLKYIKVGIHSQQQIKECVRSIIICPNLTHLVLDMQFPMDISDNQPFHFVHKMRTISRGRYPVRKSQSLRHITLFAKCVNEQANLPIASFYPEVMALFPNLDTFKLIVKSLNGVNPVLDLCLISHGKWQNELRAGGPFMIGGFRLFDH